MDQGRTSGRGLAPGELVAGRYRVLGTIGRGGFGAVYEAEHVTLKRTVALKVLLPEVADNRDVVERFMREARAAASIGHPGIVEVFDLDTHEGTAFLAMERLEGEELYDRIRRDHPLDASFVAGLGADVADAIGAAHAHGIVHRDLKPQNVFLARGGRRRDVVKVLDFGIAKLADADLADAPITRTGQVFGTPLYMSPEQLRGAKDVDHRADIYAIGAILYEALAGDPPFSASSYPELVLKVASETPRSLAEIRPELPRTLVAIVERSMEKAKETRFQSAEELTTALERFLHAPDEELPSSPTGSTALADTMASEGRDEVETVGTPGSVPGRHRFVAWGWMLIGIAVAGAVSSWVLATGGDADGTVASATEADDGGGSRVEGRMDHPTAAPQPDRGSTSEGPDARLPEPAEDARRTVRFDVRPRGTRVRLDEKTLCEAPCSAEVEDRVTTFRFQRAGYESEERVVMPPLPETVRVRLRALRSAESSMSHVDRPASESPAPPPLRPR